MANTENTAPWKLCILLCFCIAKNAMNRNGCKEYKTPAFSPKLCEPCDTRFFASQRAELTLQLFNCIQWTIICNRHSQN